MFPVYIFFSTGLNVLPGKTLAMTLTVSFALAKNFSLEARLHSTFSQSGSA